MAKSSFSPLYEKVAETVRGRILHGDYALKPLPSERALAQEMDVNFMTVRRGLAMLEKEKLLVRQPNGRLRVRRRRQDSKSAVNIAFLVPTVVSYDVEMWRLALETAAEAANVHLRTILYVHWKDSLLIDAIEGFDGVFLRPEAEPIPEDVADRLRRPGHPVVVVDQNFADMGIPSIQLFPPFCVQQVFNHFDSIGRTRIACFNAEPDQTSVQQRINQWRLWMGAHGYRAPLLNEPVRPHTLAMTHAFSVIERRLAAGKLDFDALFCTSSSTAVGAMRAFLNAGIRPGTDVAVAAANGEGIAAMMNPTLTALEAPDPLPYIRCCLEWMAQGAWQGPLLMEPNKVPLFIGHSSAPPEAERTTKALRSRV